jgi:hypothetical protein
VEEGPRIGVIGVQKGPHGWPIVLARESGAGFGMLVVETIAKIRREYFQDRKPIKQICRELRVSRKTVRKVVRSGATEFPYERSVQPQPKIGPWRTEIDELLAENARRPKRERLTHIRIFEELRAVGYDSGYDAVRRYAAAWSKAETEASAAAYVPLSFDPGEAYQFDWSHEIVLIDGVTTTVKVAHVRLCHSPMPFHAVPASVSKTCLVRFDKNRYSVEVRAVGRPVEIRAYAERVEFWQNGQVVGRHPRVFGRNKAIYDPLHYIPVLAHKPGALRNGAPSRSGSCRLRCGGCSASSTVCRTATARWSTSSGPF